MSFLGLEKPIEYSGVQVFDPTMAKMVLDAQDKYFNVLYADYQQGLQDMKEFKKEYGDFITPILADQEWYNKNVTGKVRNFINDAYARGIDLTRSAEGRAAIAQMINSIDVGSVAKLKSSAENAKEYLKARRQLEAQGLYNPLLAKYEGFDTNTYNTLDKVDSDGNIIPGRDIWDKMSPTRITDMATFGNPYFEGMKPNVRKVSKNGAIYNIEAITEDDLKGIANSHFNELVSTPQGNLMYQYYRDIAQQNGFTGRDADEKAREYFNSAVADGQRRRIYEKTELDDGWAERQKIAQGWAKIKQDEDQFNRLMQALYGNQSLDTLPLGAADQVALDQDKLYNKVFTDFVNDIVNKEKSTYKVVVDKGYKNMADQYKKDSAIVSSKTATEDQKKRARARMENVKSYDKEMKDWTDSYDKYTNRESEWLKYGSSSTEWGKEQNESQLYSRARLVFDRQNLIGSINSIDTGILSDMNHALGLKTNEDGKVIGRVTNGTEFAPITEAAMTGNRLYRYNSIFSKINRILQDKDYEISTNNSNSRKYGSGTVKGTRYNIIRQIATFKGEDLNDILGDKTDKELNSMGIVKHEDGSNVTYDIPIISKFSIGSQTWANVNTETDKRIGGTTEANKYRTTRLANSVLRPIK